MKDSNQISSAFQRRRRNFLRTVIIALALQIVLVVWYGSDLLTSTRLAVVVFTLPFSLIVISSNFLRCPSCRLDMLPLWAMEGNIYNPNYCPFCRVKLTERELPEISYYPSERVPTGINRRIVRKNIKWFILGMCYVFLPAILFLTMRLLRISFVPNTNIGLLIAVITLLWIFLGLYSFIFDPFSPRCRGCSEKLRGSYWRYCPKCAEVIAWSD